jgi:hypothetical protein
VDFDTGGTSGLIVLYEGSDRPSGNIFLPYKGFYRLSGQIYALPPPAEVVSLYVGLYDLGPVGGDHRGPIYSANQYLPNSNHPSLSFQYLIRASEPRYYSIEVYYLTYAGPAEHSLVEGDNYNFLQIEYLGGAP